MHGGEQVAADAGTSVRAWRGHVGPCRGGLLRAGEARSALPLGKMGISGAARRIRHQQRVAGAPGEKEVRGSDWDGVVTGVTPPSTVTVDRRDDRPLLYDAAGKPLRKDDCIGFVRPARKD